MTTIAPGVAPSKELEPKARELVFDLLRIVALARVVTWHTIPAGWLTWFAAMPVMFFVAGVFLARSASSRSYSVLLRDRLRRQLVPLWAYGSFVAVTSLSRPFEVARACHRSMSCRPSRPGFCPSSILPHQTGRRVG